MKVLVVAPHPDDEVLGCGGTIAKHAQAGDEVHLCIVTQAYTPDWSEEFLKNRPVEIEDARKVLGVRQVHMLGFPTVKLDTVPQKTLNASLEAVFEKVGPDVVYLPHHGDVNMDHRIVFESCMVAVRPIRRGIRRLLSYETLSETEWGIPAEPFVPNVYVDVTGTIEKKTEAMKMYRSEIKQAPHPRSAEIIEALAKKRGSEANVRFAEAFMLIRETI